MLASVGAGWPASTGGRLRLQQQRSKVHLQGSDSCTELPEVKQLPSYCRARRLTPTGEIRERVACCRALLYPLLLDLPLLPADNSSCRFTPHAMHLSMYDRVVHAFGHSVYAC